MRATSPSILKQFTFLALACAASGSLAATIGDMGSEEKQPILEPEKQAQPVKTASIDTEVFELGAYAGVLNIEDFNSNLITGFSFNYHFFGSYIAQLNYAVATASKAGFEENSGQNFLADDDYDFRYLSLNAGYKVLEGRSYLGSKRKMESAIYLLGGIETVEFADDSNIGVGLGASYRVVATDWLTINVDIKDHIVNRDFIGDSKLTHNTEFSLGINGLF
ncbi:outer membrane beta-barrel domain-containing protein [Teredinibacter turnerae]|uniref:outer membrane beta-barrel domain-containing protein n=1 Tax=Teredinibacter turnerae TaxID=2426 RepID=UPI0005F873D6|nr:outer membrane beta-barrel domain-containing protein [Teredinibacter turnerae]